MAIQSESQSWADVTTLSTLFEWVRTHANQREFNDFLAIVDETLTPFVKEGNRCSIRRLSGAVPDNLQANVDFSECINAVIIEIHKEILDAKPLATLQYGFTMDGGGQSGRILVGARIPNETPLKVRDDEKRFN